MAFWNQAALEPKRQYKFLLSFPSSANRIESYLVKRVDKPKFTVNAVQHDFLNHRFFYPGKLVWDPITITVVDIAQQNSAGNMSLRIMDAIKATGYEKPDSPSNPKGRQTLSKRNSVNLGLGQAKIQTLNADGDTVDNWVLHNAFITSLEFGSLDYTVEELVEITMTFQYDYAVLSAGGS